MSNTTPISQENIVVGEVANGLPLTIPVYRLKGDGTGPSVYVQANMHGAEVQGNAVIYQLLEQLKQLNLKGDITLVPYANPIGCNQKSGEFTLGRFDPITGTNWNRMYHCNSELAAKFAEQYSDADDQTLKAAFKAALIDNVEQQLSGPAYRLTTGKRIALNLQKLAHQADIVLDLHTGPISSQHLYCPDYAKQSASYFNIPHVLLIPNDFDGAMDEASFCPWWQLTEQLAKQGREFNVQVEAFTVELGSQEKIDLSAALDDANSILSYLNYKHVFVDAPFQPKQMKRYGCNLDDYFAYYAPMGGMVEYIAPLGGHIKAGDPIAKVLRMECYLSEQPLQTLTLDCDAIAILHFASASVNQGTELYKFFTNVFEL
ncbi:MULTISPECIES: succinylglutamate desuccinylase/aspartoacylase family protein [unclassified Pseudoalteromonas]|uniref:succinylglutamate desuccinylase/aspartoacylase family protein n=1 Tax=unclassified Pseudoalteromonas TaxID=194690 RepID=UPI0025B34A7C|nr:MULTISPECIES: succinylglutamate desuccinylase/aspartoacylase family protein [unclassified Pseudoalteromonas]MDN3380393.1 M14 family metallopeptidase [Pseudoalteromonas sp. APC 3893]MDN3388778.1 M14 family metallopeptidase [Pseudoalteromonas sp. APC 4017]